MITGPMRPGGTLTLHPMQVRPRHRTRDALLAAATVVVAIVAAIFVLRGASTPPRRTTAPPRAVVASGPKTCIYTRTGISGLEQAAALLHVPADCTVIFHRAALTWSEWDTPWFIDAPIANNNWARWARQPGHRLIITLGLIPAAVVHQDWRTAGAHGEYAGYARLLAANLVRSGLGHAIIRLSNEPNGDWFTDNAGTTPGQVAEWVQFWRRTVTAMRSVPGEHFAFDWTIANGIGNVGLAALYPGDRYVNYIGDDVYDNHGGQTAAERWAKLSMGPLGIDAVLAFAQQHGKPFTIPEWGLEPSNSGGGGDDPAFVDGIAALARRPDFGYQGYFFAGWSAYTLAASPLSIAAYRRDFGTHA
jgi:Glycosyl hydrolase family 26